MYTHTHTYTQNHFTYSAENDNCCYFQSRGHIFCKRYPNDSQRRKEIAQSNSIFLICEQRHNYLFSNLKIQTVLAFVLHVFILLFLLSSGIYLPLLMLVLCLPLCSCELLYIPPIYYFSYYITIICLQFVFSISEFLEAKD